MIRSLGSGPVAAAVVLAAGSCNVSVAMAQPVQAPAPAAAPSLPVRLANDFTLIGQQVQGGWLRGLAPFGARSVALGGKPVELEPDGSFFIAFDRDSGPMAELVARRGDLPVIRRTLSIAPRAWRIEHVNAPFRPPGLPDASFAEIRGRELAMIGAARARSTDAAGWRQAMAWPLKGALRGRFGSQRVYQGKPGSYHGGLDIAGASGTPFMAPADGVVVLATASPFTLEGNLLILDHGAGLSSAFLHCARLAVREGDRVKQGQLVGWVGMTGRATGPHLHWALKWRDAKLDPLLFLPPQG
ncbi:M23 family metallopeptidase [Novosphingobium sp. TH158]|uniref:M23 family metallopeptidase n=1 Tax=Novosphingobium sp. TH158 TaxID=2067455 RepID=UPI000C7E43DE|nr:M23 family metallopeptidase [Novosphingobium sp. TH158]PLK27265.1 peptidase [Novosphingobium sp. TH158]